MYVVLVCKNLSGKVGNFLFNFEFEVVIDFYLSIFIINVENNQINEINLNVIDINLLIQFDKQDFYNFLIFISFSMIEIYNEYF